MLSAAGFAALLSLGGVSSASASPLGAVQKTIADGGSVETVDYRGGRRHCHWNSGRKWCHGGVSRYNGNRYYGNRYGYGPGITLRFGFGGDRDRRYNRRYWR
jgi:hypothetical protein